MTLHSSYQSRIGLTIDEVHIISGQLQSDQHRSSQQLNEHSRLLSDILRSQSNLQDFLRLQNSPDTRAQIATTNSTTDHPDRLSSSVVRTRAYVSQHQRSPCTPYCRCACHNARTFQTPALLHEVIGTLFIGYSGYPIKAFQECTEVNFVSQSIFRGYVHYLFPSWFLYKAIMVTLMTIFLNEISLSLTVRRIVPSGAELLRLVKNDDVDGIKRLFDMGMASPNDSLESGGSVVTVRSISISINKIKVLDGSNCYVFGTALYSVY